MQNSGTHSTGKGTAPLCTQIAEIAHPDPSGARLGVFPENLLKSDSFLEFVSAQKIVKMLIISAELHYI